jgi:hypothetical protein
MKKVFSKLEGLENRGCYSIRKALSLSFMQKDSFTIEELVNSEIPLTDKYWFVLKKCSLTVKQKKQIAVDIAEIVLPLYEAQYPSDKRVRDCIETTKLFLAGHVSLDQLLFKCQAAADAASDAADAAAYAAYDAADAAAYAAYDAADAAAYAAYDAADAAAYAAYDAADDAYYAADDAADAAYDAADAAAVAAYDASDAAAVAAYDASDVKKLELEQYLLNIIKGN